MFENVFVWTLYKNKNNKAQMSTSMIPYLCSLVNILLFEDSVLNLVQKTELSDNKSGDGLLI